MNKPKSTTQEDYQAINLRGRVVLSINTTLPLHSQEGRRTRKNSLKKPLEVNNKLHQNAPFTLEIKSNLIEIQAISALHQVARM